MKTRNFIALAVAIVLGLFALGFGLYYIFNLRASGKNEFTNSFTTMTQALTTPTVVQSGAVATSADECTDLAVDILKSGGSAVDSAVTATLCQGLVVSQSSGLGGGLVATVFIKNSGILETINSREIAPAAAFKDMFPDNLSSLEGGLAIAVPGELKGLHELHKRYGKLKWAEVVQPVIELAEKGYKVTKYLGEIFNERGDKIKSKAPFK